MVLYFSTTGNTEYIAKQIAERLGDQAVDLLPLIRSHDHSEIHSDSPFIICAPVYVCEMPDFVADHLAKTSLTGCRDVYFVFTSGGYCGISGPLAHRLVRKKGMRYRGCAELVMPQNYIATNLYDELEDSEIERRIAESSGMVDEIAETIRNGEDLKSRHKWLIEYASILPLNPVWQKVMQPVRPFYATDKCTGCGLCAGRCPLNRIRMMPVRNSGKVSAYPKWTGRSCAHCMSCIQNCPVHAIEYGNITPGKKRYIFRNYQYAASREISDAHH